MADTAIGTILNDVHSALNPTRVARVVRPVSIEDVIAAVRLAATEERAVSIAGSRHSMGGQQFAADHRATTRAIVEFLHAHLIARGGLSRRRFDRRLKAPGRLGPELESKHAVNL